MLEDVLPSPGKMYSVDDMVGLEINSEYAENRRYMANCGSA